MENFKVAADVAEAEFERFADTMDLDVDASAMGDEDRADFEQHKRVVVGAIMRGSLVINDAGEPVYTCQRGDLKGTELTWREPDGAALLAMDQQKKGRDVAKTYATMAAICKVPPATFSKMKQGDLKVCSSLLVLFLA